ncbi:zeta toxin family protein [Lactococcus hircilactis]|uniref:zeta toxin family protein n=1 Tax=Lactococcus hircilactis TaxID=1494462 RepID=UPI003FA1ACA0
MSLEDFTEDYFNKQVRLNIRDLTAGIQPPQIPHAFLLGGQSGAGKSSITKFLEQTYEADYITIDGDSFRPQHPQSQLLTEKYGKSDVNYTAQFAGQMVGALIEELSNKKYNLIIEGTLRTFETPFETAKLLSDKGYNVELYAMAVKPELSYLSTIHRYEKMLKINPEAARSTPKKHHDLIIEKMPKNLDELSKSGIFSDITLMSRSMDILYRQSEMPSQLPSEILTYIWGSEWTADEIEMFHASVKQTLSLMKARSDANTNELNDLITVVLHQISNRKPENNVLSKQTYSERSFKEKLTQARDREEKLNEAIERGTKRPLLDSERHL